MGFTEPMFPVQSAQPNLTGASDSATRTSSSFSSACAPETSWSCTRNAPLNSRSCSPHLVNPLIIEEDVMLLLKYLLVVASIGFFGAAAAVLVADVVKAVRSAEPLAVRWRLAARLALFAWLPLLPALSIVVVPSGMAGVRVSQLSG